jgi:hypothetical protein
MNLGSIEILLLLLMCLPVLIVIAIAILLITRRQDVLRIGRRQCPFCAEWIRPQAKVCPFCGRDLPLDWNTRHD